MRFLFLLLYFLMVSTPSFAKILPDNDMWKDDGKWRGVTGMTEARFLELADEVIETMDQYAMTHGKGLLLDPKWDSSEVNAYAYPLKDYMMVEMHGGLARRPEVTEDGFQLVVCHEVGHHLGGFALYSRGDWAASEGQSDYYASHVCAKEIWKDDLAQNAMYETIAPRSLKKKCKVSYRSDEERALCYRTGMAGVSLATLLANGAKVDVSKRDTHKTEVTKVTHPPGQCRLDTYVSGGLCTVAFDKHFIPQTEEHAKATSCMRSDGFEIEARPRCWFAPGTSDAPLPDELMILGLEKGEGIYALEFRSVPSEAKVIRLFWGFEAQTHFAEFFAEGSDFVTENSWGLGDKLDLRVSFYNENSVLLFEEYVSL